MSVGLGFINEYHAERAVNALHDRLRHRALVHRDGHLVSRDVADLVPGDVVELRTGTVVPADVRLTAARALQCDESVLSGEALLVAKTVGDTALMGTVVAAGTAAGEVTATAARTAFGQIAVGITPQLLPAVVTTSLATGARPRGASTASRRLRMRAACGSAVFSSSLIHPNPMRPTRLPGSPTSA